jgi:uncharacterized protein DUF3658
MTPITFGADRYFSSMAARAAARFSGVSNPRFSARIIQQYCLYFEMLELVYAQHPELRPPAVPPTINSDLRWKDVTLPKSVSEADLDAIIFSILTSRRQKAAMVIGKAMRHCREHNLPVDDEVFGARIEALAESGRIQGFGDLRLWGHSEVKLKD